MRALIIAFRNLRRGGQRVVLATACVAFGVMSLVALQLLSNTINDSIGVDPRCVVGGDASLSRPGGLEEADLQLLSRLKSESRLEDFALVSESFGGLARRSGDGRVHFLHRVIAIDPAQFPLVGTIEILGGRSTQDLLAAVDAALVTSDVAEKLELRAGDEITVAPTPTSAPRRFVVAGIVLRTPDQRGGTVFHSLAMKDSADRPSAAYVLWGANPPSIDSLKEQFTVTLPDEVAAERKEVAGLFDFMLKGAAILGLLLAGIGVANTMQVLLARRRVEIATLKSVGFERRHLILLLGMESALIGMMGGLVGAPIGITLSVWLRTLLGRMGPILLTQSLDGGVIAGSFFVGVVVAVVFALHAIVRASDVRPALLLRDQPTPRAWKESVTLCLLLIAVFSGMAAVVLGSATKGALVAGGGFIGLVILGTLLGGGLAFIVRVPFPLPAIVQLARNSLQRRVARALVALVALFCGVFSIGFSGAIISNASERFERRSLPGDGLNLAIHASTRERESVEAAHQRKGLYDFAVIATTDVTATASDGSALPDIKSLASVPQSLEVVKVENAPTSVEGNGALVPSRLREKLAHGDPIVVRGSTGESASVVVTGYYDAVSTSPLVPRPTGLIVDESLAATIGGENGSVTFLSRVDPENQVGLARELGRELPAAMVMSRRDFNSILQGVLENLFAFVIAVAGLALVAGAVLIANSVGLAMVERQKETAILRALGYSAARVLGGIGIEYSMLGALAGVFGMAAVAVAFLVINAYQPQAKLTLNVVQAITLVSCSTGIALASAVAVAWRPIHARPLATLRRE